jgi:hypothetical protein
MGAAGKCLPGSDAMVTMTEMSDHHGEPPLLLGYVRALENRNSYTRGEQVLAALAEMGIKPVIQECRWPVIRNIIVDFSADSHKQYLLFSAHYDVVKGSPGANDNASSVAVLLGLCRELLHRPRPVRIVFFDREEAWFHTPVLRLGLLGSLYYVWKTDLKNVAAVYNLEFCGQGDVLGIWPVKDVGKLPAVRQVAAIASRLGIQYRTTHIPWPFMSSDHLSFRLKGYPNAVTLSLLPSGQIPLLENLMCEIRPIKLLTGRRPTLPEPLHCIHSSSDSSASLSEHSLKLMLSLLIELADLPELVGGDGCINQIPDTEGSERDQF